MDKVAPGAGTTLWSSAIDSGVPGYPRAVSDMYPPALPPAVAMALLPNEHVYWTGNPDPRVWFRARDIPVVIFGLIFTAFAVFWESSAISMGAPTFFAFWGIPFILVGLYTAFGRLAHRAWQRRHTTYVLTDQRALAVTGGKVRAFPATEGPREITTRGSGSHVTLQYGDVVQVADSGSTWNIGTTWGGSGTRQALTGVVFEDVADVNGLLDASRRVTTRKRPIQDT